MTVLVKSPYELQTLVSFQTVDEAFVLLPLIVSFLIPLSLGHVGFLGSLVLGVFPSLLGPMCLGSCFPVFRSLTYIYPTFMNGQVAFSGFGRLSLTGQVYGYPSTSYVLGFDTP